MQFNRYPFDVSVGFVPATYRFQPAMIILQEETETTRSCLLFTFAWSSFPQLFSLEEVRNRGVEGIVVSLAENVGLVTRN